MSNRPKENIWGTEKKPPHWLTQLSLSVSGPSAHPLLSFGAAPLPSQHLNSKHHPAAFAAATGALNRWLGAPGLLLLTFLWLLIGCAWLAVWLPVELTNRGSHASTEGWGALLPGDAQATEASPFPMLPLPA